MSLLMLLSDDSAAPAWSPADLTGVLDYGDLSNTALLKQNSDGSGDVSDGTPLGWWQGHLGILTLKQATAGNKPSFSSTGIVYTTSGANRWLNHSLIPGIAYNAPLFVAIRCSGSVGIGPNTISTYSPSTGLAAKQTAVSGVTRDGPPFDIAAATTDGSFKNFSFVFTGTGNGTGYVNNAGPVTATAGTNTTIITELSIGKWSVTTNASKASKWVVCTTVPSEAERTMINDWLDS